MDSTAQMARIARAVTAAGTDAFPEALTALLQSAFAFDSLFVSVFTQDHAPRQLYSNLDDDATRRTIGPYLSYAYLLDPFYGLFKADVGTSVVSLDACAPDDFRNSEYFRMFYSDTGLRDEVTIFVACGHGSSIVLSLGQRMGRPRRDTDACPRLQALLPLIAALCHKHWPNPAIIAPSATPVGLAFDRLDMPKLSTREAEVVRLMLQGHSTKSMARLMGNSPETVKVHRKRIYSKLGICSQGELFSRFLSELGGVPMAADVGVQVGLVH
jgi:DNA-binding CsgD family transcriptional regulator